MLRKIISALIVLSCSSIIYATDLQWAQTETATGIPNGHCSFADQRAKNILRDKCSDVMGELTDVKCSLISDEKVSMVISKCERICQATCRNVQTPNVSATDLKRRENFASKIKLIEEMIMKERNIVEEVEKCSDRYKATNKKGLIDSLISAFSPNPYKCNKVDYKDFKGGYYIEVNHVHVNEPWPKEGEEKPRTQWTLTEFDDLLNLTENAYKESLQDCGETLAACQKVVGSFENEEKIEVNGESKNLIKPKSIDQNSESKLERTRTE
jgi:hypothetical protein